eukprot:1082405-Pleurochrysis_carterae.AAC.9
MLPQVWEVKLFEWAFDEDCSLYRDLQAAAHGFLIEKRRGVHNLFVRLLRLAPSIHVSAYKDFLASPNGEARNTIPPIRGRNAIHTI